MTKKAYEDQLKQVIEAESELLVAKCFELKGYELVNKMALSERYRQYTDIIVGAPKDSKKGYRIILQVKGSAGKTATTSSHLTIPFESYKKCQAAYEAFKAANDTAYPYAVF